MKIHPVGTENGRTDMTKLKLTFPQLGERVLKETLHFASTVYLCVPYDSHNKPPLFHQIFPACSLFFKLKQTVFCAVRT